MKTIKKKMQKDRAQTIHMTSVENRYLRIRKRETGLSISDVIRAEYLTDAADSFFNNRAQAAASDGASV